MNENIQVSAECSGTSVKRIVVVWAIILVLSMIFLYALSFLLPTLAQLAVQKDPTMNNTEAFRALGEGEPEKAEELFTLSLKQDSDQDLPHFGLAMIQRNKGELTEALEHANKAIDKNPKDVRFYLTKADILADMDRYDESIAAASDALEYKQRADDIYVKMGHIYTMADNLEKAEDAFYQGLALNPDNELAERGLAVTYMGQGNPEKALTSWKRLVTRFPSNPEYRFYFGLCLLDSGETEEGVKQLNKAKSLAPDGYEDKVDNQLKKRGL